jgi:hypothetical protein
LGISFLNRKKIPSPWAHEFMTNQNPRRPKNALNSQVHQRPRSNMFLLYISVPELYVISRGSQNLKLDNYLLC